MTMRHKCRTAINAFREGGVPKVVGIVASKCASHLPLPVKLKWKTGLRSEIQFWDNYVRTRGLHWAADYRDRMDPDFPLQSRLAALLPPETAVDILDVGAGPLTCLGKKAPNRQVRITAVDPLAEEYDKILDKYGVQPIVRTQKLEAEALSEKFSENTFDLCFARNCLDHTYDPERAILQMIDVVKEGHHVLLEHFPNEAENEKYTGLHQWNLDLSSDKDLVIRSKTRATNITRKYADRCKISCKFLKDGERDWLITWILKKTSLMLMLSLPGSITLFQSC